MQCSLRTLFVSSLHVVKESLCCGGWMEGCMVCSRAVIAVASSQCKQLCSCIVLCACRHCAHASKKKEKVHDASDAQYCNHAWGKGSRAGQALATSCNMHARQLNCSLIVSQPRSNVVGAMEQQRRVASSANHRRWTGMRRSASSHDHVQACYADSHSSHAHALCFALQMSLLLVWQVCHFPMASCRVGSQRRLIGRRWNLSACWVTLDRNRY
jgi:hypothetical protein